MPEDLPQSEELEGMVGTPKGSMLVGSTESGSDDQRHEITTAMKKLLQHAMNLHSNQGAGSSSKSVSNHRDRACSFDAHMLRSSATRDAQFGSKGPSSTSSTPPFHPVAVNGTPPQSPIDLLTNQSSLQMPIQCSRLYNLLVKDDANNHGKCNESESKRPKIEPTLMKISVADFVPGARRFTFNGFGTRDVPVSTTAVRLNSVTEKNRPKLVPPAHVTSHSILSTLIGSGKESESPGPSSSSTDSGVDEPLDLTPRKSPNDPMQLANKTVHPVQARITELFRMVVNFVHTHGNLNDSWMEVLRRVWHYLLVIYIAESGLEVVIVEAPAKKDREAGEDPILPWLRLPEDISKLKTTRKESDLLLECLESMRKQELTPKEFDVLRKVVCLSKMKNEIPEKTLKSVMALRMLEHGQGALRNLASPKQLLYPLQTALIKMINLSAPSLAGLLCGHLRGESSKDLLLLEISAQKSVTKSRRAPSLSTPSAELPNPQFWLSFMQQNGLKSENFHLLFNNIWSPEKFRDISFNTNNLNIATSISNGVNTRTSNDSLSDAQPGSLPPFDTFNPQENSILYQRLSGNYKGEATKCSNLGSKAFLPTTLPRSGSGSWTKTLCGSKSECSIPYIGVPLATGGGPRGSSLSTDRPTSVSSGNNNHSEVGESILSSLICDTPSPQSSVSHTNATTAIEQIPRSSHHVNSGFFYPPTRGLRKL